MALNVTDLVDAIYAAMGIIEEVPQLDDEPAWIAELYSVLEDAVYNDEPEVTE